MLNQSRILNRYILINNFNICQCNICRCLSSKTDCCKPQPQTEGKIVVKRSPKERKCISYDPYRIKGPNIVVPPLPPSKAKPMIECRCQKGPCSGQVPSVPPPPVPPPKKPFPWIYVWPWILLFSTMGAIYRYYLWREEMERTGDNKPIWRPRLAIRRPLYEKDLPVCVQYLIVGAGAAGWAAYISIMQHHPTAKVFIITNEDSMPYIRIPISKFMWWNKEAPDPKEMNYIADGKIQTMLLAKCSEFLDPEKFVRREEGPAVSIASGWNVVRVDPDEHVVYLKTSSGERPIYYERCLLATGSRPKTLNIFKVASKDIKERVCTLRTVRDLEIAYRKVKESKHVTIIGGGNLGSELAWHLGKMNKILKEDNQDAPELVHVIKNKGILAGLLPQYLGEWAAEKIRNEGVKLISQAQVYDAFMTKDKRLQLTLSNGESIVTDYVLVAVGAEPRTDIGDQSNLELDPVNGGFLVNTELEARKHLFVAGDAASVYTEWKDTRLRFEHFGNAWETGMIAGANMTGYWTSFNLEPHYRFSLGDVIQMEVIGEAGACMPTIGLFKQCEDDEADLPQTPVHVANTGDKPCYKKTPEYKSRYKHGLLFYMRDEHVVGILFWNIPPIPDRVGVVQEILRARPTCNDIDMLAEMLGFNTTECVYTKKKEHPAEKLQDCPKLTNVKTW